MSKGAQAAARTPAVSATDPASRVAPPRGLDPNNLRATGDFRSGIRRSFDTATPALRDCYQELLEFEPGLVDDLVFEVEVVMIEGEVDAELIAIEAPNTQIDDLDCFARAVDDVSFPAPEGEDPVTVRYDRASPLRPMLFRLLRLATTTTRCSSRSAAPSRRGSACRSTRSFPTT